MTIEKMVDKVAYDSLLATSPKMIRHIKTLVMAGETPEQIGKRIAKISVYYASLAVSAAYHIQSMMMEENSNEQG